MFDAHRSKFRAEIGVATIKKIDTVNQAFAISGRCSDDVRESSTKIGDHEFGTVAPGKLADLLVVDGDVASDISLLEDRTRFIAVVQGGKIKAGRLAGREIPRAGDRATTRP